MRNFLIAIVIICSIQLSYSQEDGVVSLALPVRNSLKFNKFLIDPTFSFVKEQSTAISVYSKKQWAQFDNAPQTYLFSYAGRITEKQGVAIGLFQQNHGVLTKFGGVVNFAQNVELAQDSNLTFGLNLGFYKSGLNSGSVITNYPDPSLENIPSNFLFSIKPGINYGTTFLDFGVSINNLFLYNFKTSKMIEDDPDKSIELHAMYTGYLESYGFFDKSKFSTLIKTDLKKEKTVISGLVLFAIPSGVWVQGGYNTLYGMSAGLGLNVTPRISVEYNFEKATGNFSNFGPSHEITLAYRFKPNRKYAEYDEEEGSIINPSEIKKYVPSENNAVTPTKTTPTNKAKVAVDTKTKADALAQSKATADAKRKADADAKAKLAADTKAKQDAIAQAKLAAANAKIKADADAKAKQTADAKAKLDLLAQSKATKDAKTKADADAKAKQAADTKAKEAAIAQAKALADAKTKADADAKAKQAADTKAKEAALAQAKAADKDAKAKADADAKAKLAADTKAKEEALAQAKAAAKDAKAKLAADTKAKEDASAQAKAADKDAKAKADADAKAKLAADIKAKEAALAQAKVADKDAKAKADADAKAKLAADTKAKEEALAQAKAAAKDAKAKADADAKAKEEALAQAKAAEKDAKAKDAIDATINAAQDSKAKLAAEAKAKEEALAQAQVLANDDNAKSMRDLAEFVELSKNSQEKLLKKLDATVIEREKDLNDLKEENDLREKGIFKELKPFKSISAQNSAFLLLKSEIDVLNKSQDSKIKALESLYNERLKKANKKEDITAQYYLKTIQTLKSDQAEVIKANTNLLSSIEKINEETEIAKKRRIKLASFENDEGRYINDVATLKRIKETTPLSNEIFNATDFDYGDVQSNIQIVKNVKNVEGGYYLIVAVHNDVAKRDEFLKKAVAAGEKDINFFYDVNTSKYFIYYSKYDSINQALKAQETKGSKPYNGKMTMVRVEN